MAGRTIKLAVVRSMDDALTCVGPDDFKDDFADAMTAAMSWHLEAGHLPVARYWVWVELPPLPTIPDLKAKAEVSEFPRSFIEEMDAQC